MPRVPTSNASTQVHISAGGCEEIDTIQDYCLDGSTTIVQNIGIFASSDTLEGFVGGLIGAEACENKDGSAFADLGAKLAAWWKGANLSLSRELPACNAACLCH